MSVKALYKRVVIKIGSNVLANADATLNIDIMSSLVNQIAELRASGVQVILVSSGAVASGRSELKHLITRKMDAVSERQLFSSVGQAKLINRYYDLFAEHNIVCGQVLTTKESLSTRDHYLNQRNCMGVMLDNGVIPIINENDTISVTELMFTDNDELSGLVSTMMGAEALIILSNVDGIYNGNPNEEGTEVITEILPEHRDLTQYIQAGKSNFGRGGMLTKTRIASKVADQGVEVIIANGKSSNILEELILSHDAITCTRFVPSVKPVSGVKKWIAHSEGFAKGELHINQGAMDALLKPDAVSLLPVGVERVEGEFEKDDIVKIISPEGSQIGVGKTAYDSAEAKKIVGEKGAKAMIHYDYLYLD
ncbi:MAG: glutamate 5-kinase [Rikenellaceae bacterium]